MGKRERKIEAIRKYIENLAGTWSAYFYGNIPKQQAENACSSYAQEIQRKDILGLVDVTVNGSGKKGMIFTEYYLYYDSGMQGNRGKFSYKELYENHAISQIGGAFGDAHSQQALSELVSLLADADAQNLQERLDHVEDTLAALRRSVKKTESTINMAMEVLVENVESRKEAEEKGFAKGVLSSVKNLMESMGWTEKESMQALKISEEEQKEYLKILL